ncbi:uncharacterized protein MONBRDRAFT_4868 [Monosiga brevicollis MX1]|uniref:Uncharacterized protein n=1 Tax=Monosiga brevicollis TaxID=81824 RepID=A9UP65_MONBE|nr:uncharacterized protein MONBRDRAFT_4868 [Monosiga brevicollis MX1]EDQ92820.1 predicted protein [Monosiga brevicollis MX1]|eukprot:XP_001742582.1 hypothetical protein [Monosiga brevicollis MX1]
MAESQNKKVKRQEKAAPVVDTEDAEEAPTTLMAADLVEEGDDDTLNVSFNAFQPIGDDFWGIKTLLQQMMPRADADLGELARTIIDKAEQSTVIKVEQDPTSGIVASDKAAQAAAQEAASDAVDGATDEDPDGAYDVYAVMSPLRMGDIKVALHRAAFEVSVVQDSEGSYPYRAFRQCLVLDYETFAKTARQLGEMYTTVYEDVEDGEDDE